MSNAAGQQRTEVKSAEEVARAQNPRTFRLLQATQAHGTLHLCGCRLGKALGSHQDLASAFASRRADANSINWWLGENRCHLYER